MRYGMRKRNKTPWAKVPGIMNSAGRLKSMEMRAAVTPQSFKRVALSPSQPHSKTYGH